MLIFSWFSLQVRTEITLEKYQKMIFMKNKKFGPRFLSISTTYFKEKLSTLLVLQISRAHLVYIIQILRIWLIWDQLRYRVGMWMWFLRHFESSSTSIENQKLCLFHETQRNLHLSKSTYIKCYYFLSNSK